MDLVSVLLLINMRLELLIFYSILLDLHVYSGRQVYILFNAGEFALFIIFVHLVVVKLMFRCVVFFFFTIVCRLISVEIILFGYR